MANPQAPIVHSVPDNGVIKLDLAKGSIAKVAVSGTDMILVLADGSQHVLRDFALRMMTNPGLKVAFSDAPMSALDLFNSVGKIDFTQMAGKVAASAPVEAAVPTTAPAPKPAAPETPDKLVKPEAAEAAPPPPAPAPHAPEGIVQPPVSAEATKVAELKADNPPAPAPAPVMHFDSPPAAASSGTNNNPPPPPPPPPETIAINATWHNVTGQSTGSQDGKTLITGSGGSPRSGSDLSPEAQAEREIILGTAGDDIIIGDNTTQLGTGFARVLDIQLAARTALTVDALTIAGLPGGVTIDGATQNGDTWVVDLPPDFSSSGNHISLVLRYGVASDDQAFSPAPFNLTISADGKIETGPINGARVVPGVVQDVNSAADMAYSANGKDGMVLAAFGLGDEIFAGGGNDTVKAGVGHDIVHGDAGNDTLDGGAGNDILEGGSGADQLIGGSGRDTALYAASEEAVTIDLAKKTATGGQAEGDTFTSIENLTGSSHDDVLRGDASANRLDGGAGDDVLEGRAGADQLIGGDGLDSADYSAAGAAVTVNLGSSSGSGSDAEGDTFDSIEAVTGSAFNDKLTGSAAANRLEGGAGDDTLEGGAGADQLLGGKDQDTAVYSASNAAVSVSLGTGQGRGGDAEGDRLQDIENLLGSKNDDELSGNDSANVLNGGAGNDWLEGGAGADTLIGGDGQDTASYLEARTGVVASLENPTANTGDAQGDTFQGIENLEGSEYNDVLTGDGQANIIWAGPGDDQLFGKGGNDTLFGGAGRDVIDGGDGVDSVTYSTGNESVEINLTTGRGLGGEAEGDTFVAIENVTGTRYGDRLIGDASNNVLDGGRGADVLMGGAGADTLIGGDGSDTAEYTTSTAAVRIDLSSGSADGGDAAGDTLQFIENLTGSAQADRLAGDASANALIGNAGDDVLDGRAGNDTLDGGAGDDQLSGGAGADVIAGGLGNDTLSYAGTTDGVAVDLTTGRGTGGEAEGDQVSGVENLVGSEGHDRLRGTADVNVLTGGKGDDVLEGGASGDTLDGGEGRDIASYASASTGVQASLSNAATNTGDAAGDSYLSIEGLTGSAFGDTLLGDTQANTLDGGAGDDLLVGGQGADTLRGGDGTDTASYTTSAQAVTIDLVAGTGQGGDAEGDVLTSVENLLGTAGADRLLGSAADNRLVGGEGNDWLEGRAGADALEGGGGSDTASYAGASAGVVANLSNAAVNTGDAAGDSYQDIEHLSGSAYADTLVGDGNDNRLDGGDGDDTLQGGQGNDALIGGAGSDTASYAGASSGVTANLGAADTNTGEAAGDSYSSIENLTGSALDDTLVGTDAANRLQGGAGDDLLIGGAGADTLEGGAGNDTVNYAASRLGVQVNLFSGLGAGGDAQGDRLTGVEDLVGSAQDDSFIGNASANRFEGGDGNDLLDGGANGDTLIGGAGDDTYVVDSVDDRVTEAAAEGTDTIRSSVAYALGLNQENLVLTGADSIDGTGNTLANEITGNEAGNRLDGGTGADRLAGGLGDDTYLVDNAGDIVTEAEGAGTDTVLATLSWRLGDNIENLTLQGTGDLNATGNALANTLIGTSGNNLMQGGAGADILQAGAGNDTASYSTSAEGVTVDLSSGRGRGGDAEGDVLSGFENLMGSDANDRLTGNSDLNILTGGRGDDVLEGGAGGDFLDGGDGSDTASYSRANTAVQASLAQALTNTGDAMGDVYTSIENLTGGNFGDTLVGDGDANRLDGGGGDDLLIGGAGGDTLTGGTGTDTVTYAASLAPVTVDLTAGTGLGGDADGDTLSLIENLIGTTGADWLGGNADDNRLLGGGGNDVLEGRAGADVLDGGAGSDTATYAHAGDAVTASLANPAVNTGDAAGDSYVDIEHLTGSAFNDTLVGDGNDNRLDGGDGDDTLQGGQGSDALVGGAGSDTASYANSTIGLIVSLAAPDSNSGEAAGDTFNSIENLLGSGLDDTLTGNDAVNKLSGGAGNDLLQGGAGADTLDGGAGNDTVSYANSRAAVAVNLLSGQGAGGDAQGDRLSLIENLVGSALDDALVGNTSSNRLEGGEGNDLLDGGAGADTLVGGAGDDTYAIDNAGDRITEVSGEGEDTVRSAISFALAANLENLTLTGTDDIDATGNSVANVIGGNAGNNRIDGGAGADTLAGGGGDDTYFVDNNGDTVTEDDGAGTDTVVASLSWRLGDNIENLTLTGSDDLNATGNALVNVLTGNGGANRLDGGAGADRMAGGGGDDTYLVDHANDLITELGAEGNDLVQSSVNYVLTANVERLELIGTANINGTGNNLANTITGNVGHNRLDGGLGGDTLDGGAGNDVYVVDNVGDRVTELGGEGTDTVESSIDYTLGANLENLTLVGSDNIRATGNSLDNLIIGNEGDNVINGGTGADQMAGGLGNDSYVVDDLNDAVTEDPGAGIDQVTSSVSITLAANVENLILTGTGALQATGNDLNNQIDGNSGNNRIDGGRGADRMTGGAGDDTYTVDNIGDQVIEAFGEGLDTVRASVTFALTLNVENATLTGNATADLSGNDLDNTLVGNSGDNIINGGTGADTMSGGAGNDTFFVDQVNDTVAENPGEGIDTVWSAVSYTLGDNLDILKLSGSANNNATGNGLDNQLLGNLGNNVLDGQGGADQMTGGDGDDTYVIDNTDDLVVEGAGAASGIDTVRSSISYILGNNLEKLVLTGNSDIDATGNELNNTIDGNAGNNVIDGGAGDDDMKGGGGDDTYLVDTAGDLVTEQANSGIDTVKSMIDYTLGVNLEKLTALGLDPLHLTGNTLNNVITGNDGDNVIDGGTGADTMAGHLGDDQYFVDNVADVVLENDDEGTDLVTASVSFALGTGVDNLTLVGTDNINATGNGLNNILLGNRGNNILDGGAGVDNMVGGLGDDTYVIDAVGDSVSELPGEGTDTIRSAINWQLGSGFENLVLTGSASLEGTGNNLANVITGNAGNNLLIGGGGADSISGGGGDDTLEFANKNWTLADGGAGKDTVKLDGMEVSSVNELLGRTTNIELLDFSGGHTDLVQVRAVDVNRSGFLGADANNRLEIVLDGPSMGADALMLDSNEYNFVTDTSLATDVGLSNGNTGKLLTSKTGGAALAVDFGTLVMPTLDELINVWGRVVDPSLNSISGMTTWLDATDVDGDGVAEGLSEAGLSAIGLSTGTVTTWVDKSGKANNFTQATLAAKPTLTLNVTNGLPVVRFDGGDSLTSNLVQGADYTVFAVGQMTGGQSGRLIASSNSNWFMGWYGGYQDRFHSDGWNTLYNNVAEVNTLKLFTAIGNNGTGQLFNNGVWDIPNQNAFNYGTETVTYNYPAQLFNQMGSLQLGAAGGVNRWEASRGDISEVIVFDHALSDGERRVVEAYLRAKWAVGGNGSAATPGVMGTVALDRTWTAAKLIYGTATADTITASYTLAAARGTGRVDSVLFGGAGNDTLNGAERVDVLFGGDGNDTLDGKLGGDWMAGGAGNDTYTVDNDFDTVIEENAAGTDTVISSINYTLTDNVENLTLTGDLFNANGSLRTARNVNGTGNALNNTIIGTNGNNVLDGGLGADTLNGGAGNDTYIVDNVNDVIIDSAGTDSVYTFNNYTLAAALENVYLIGNGDVTVTGNASANTLSTSRYGGRATLIGGLGNDNYVINQAYDGSIELNHTFVENLNEGTDRVTINRSSATGSVINFTLANNFEELNLGNSYFVNAIGNSTANYIFGTYQASIGSGNPITLSGLAGDDTYRIESPVSKVIENMGEGNDTVEAVIDARLTANVEYIKAYQNSTARLNLVNLFGNELNNTLTGWWGYNRLDGGLGADSMAGERGDDIYVVDNVGDVVTELVAYGVDTVETSLASYTLGANVEKLVFTAAGVAHSGTGNALNNWLTGNDQADTLTGLDGNDVLIGNGGADNLLGGNGNDKLMSMAANVLPAKQAGLLAEYFNNTSGNPYNGWGMGAPVFTRIEAGINVASNNGVAWPNGLYDNYGIRWTGNLQIDVAGSYTFRMNVDARSKVYLDNQLIIMNGFGAGDSLALNLAVGSHSLRVDAYEDGGNQYDILSWLKPGDGAFSVVPVSVLSYGQNTVVDADGDSLQGGAGDDWLQGADAVDTLAGGTGNDTYIVNANNDVLIENLNEGTDTIQSTITFSLDALPNFENLTLTGNAAINATGNSANNVLTGNTAVNTLVGGDGNDTLVGNGGADVLQGGLGDDTLTGDGGSLLEGGDGNDTLSLVSLWSPKALSNLGLWLDGADLDGDGVREGLGESGLNNGNQIALWKDKSGNGRDASQAFSDFQPLLAQQANGLWSPLYDGTGDGLNVKNLPSMGANVNSLFWVQNTSQENFMPLHTSQGEGYWVLIGSKTGAGSTDVVSPVDNPALDPKVTHVAASFSVDGVSANFSNRFDVWSKLNSATHTVESINQPFNFNGSMVIANGYASGGLQTGNTVTWNFGGTMPEIILTTTTALSNADKQLIEGYLAWKWGTQSLLAVAHPYKNAAPTMAALTGGTLLGGDGNDTLTGGAGDDQLDGGTGSDVMAGGLGNDTFYVDTYTDTVTELAGGGVDTIRTALTYTLGSNVEGLVLTGTDNLDGTGNNLENNLVGNDGENLLTGLDGDDVLDGGLGNDRLVGGAGDDVYVLDSAGDVVTELAGQGSDTVRAGFSLTLMANVEGLILTGTANINGTGNELANGLVGNSGNNVLDGGLGVDAMAGGAGDDTYLVDDTGDTVSELLNEGSDLVISSVSFTLGANLENLTLTGLGNINGGGNTLANILVGTSGNNTLDGSGGADRMTGGAGDDTYRVDNFSDVIVELAGEGLDNIIITGGTSYVMSDNIENLTSTVNGTLSYTGNASDNVITSGSGNNTLRGLAGNDTLDGGAGSDTMIGGIGNDTYFVDSSGDVVTELVGEGTDTVRSSIDTVLWANVENLVLTGANNLNGTGNTLNNSLTGNAANNILDGGAGTDVMTGGVGDDTYVVDASSDGVVELAGQGTDTVLSAASYTLSANVEHLTLTGTAIIDGTGNDLSNNLIGNSAANLLNAAGGDDVLNGGAGADTLIGGTGNDLYYVDNSADDVIENTGEGNDAVEATASFTLTAEVESLYLAGTANLNGTGNSLDNLIFGNVGNNILDGGAGNDTLIGGQGDDRYIVDSVGDVVFEASGAGTDTVATGLSYTLGDDLENLVLTGSADVSGTGNVQDNLITGNGGANTLDGGDGNDTLQGGAGIDTLAGGLGADSLDGGTGADAMTGGDGDDTYAIDDAGDTVVELTAEGADTVRSSISLTLMSEVESLVLTGTAALDGTGNALDNNLQGNTGDNRLDGGLGADAMAGGAGNDTYVIDSNGDVVTENSNQGTDSVESGITYSLTANVENLTLTGVGNINGTGNTLANVITGNAGHNTLNGGTGADTLIGGLGNDVYVVDNVSDAVVEQFGEGTDTVQASVSTTLSDNVENLTLTGTSAINGTGNADANTLIGNNGANVLTGGGGLDTLMGGGGNDRLVYGSASDISAADGGSGTDWLAFLTPGASVDLSTLTGRVQNIEALDASNNLGDANLVLDALSVRSLTDSRHDLVIQLDSGDTLTINGTYVETSRNTDANGELVIDYALYAGASTAGPADATVHTHFIPPH